MKRFELFKYSSFTSVEDGSNLGLLFNEVFDALEPSRSVSAPDTSSVNGWKDQKKQAVTFYDMCLLEIYLHNIIETLSEWKTVSTRYNDEFHGSWKYYAVSRRLEGIRESGGEDDDYNEDGSIKTDVSDEKLIEDTVLTELAHPHWKSIFLSTEPSDCLKYCYMIIQAGNYSFKDAIVEKTGKTFKTYRLEDGQMIENDWMDDALHKVEKQLAHDKVALLLWSALIALRNLVNEIQKLPQTEDHKEFFQSLPQRIQNILDLKIQGVMIPGVTSKD